LANVMLSVPEASPVEVVVLEEGAVVEVVVELVLDAVLVVEVVLEPDVET